MKCRTANKIWSKLKPLGRSIRNKFRREAKDPYQVVERIFSIERAAEIIFMIMLIVVLFLIFAIWGRALQVILPLYYLWWVLFVIDLGTLMIRDVYEGFKIYDGKGAILSCIRHLKKDRDNECLRHLFYYLKRQENVFYHKEETLMEKALNKTLSTGNKRRWTSYKRDKGFFRKGVLKGLIETLHGATAYLSKEDLRKIYTELENSFKKKRLEYYELYKIIDKNKERLLKIDKFAHSGSVFSLVPRFFRGLKEYGVSIGLVTTLIYFGMVWLLTGSLPPLPFFGT